MVFTNNLNSGKVPNPWVICPPPYSEQMGIEQKEEITAEINYVI